MADDTATLKILAEVREAIQNLGKFDDKWKESTGKTKKGGEEASVGVELLEHGIQRLGIQLTAVGLAVKGIEIIADVFKEAGAQIVDSVRSAGAAELATAKLEAILKATGNTTGLTTDTLLELANAEQHVTGASDEEVQAVERIFLATKKLSGDALPRAIKLSFDLASQMEGGSSEAAHILAKALAEPDKAVELLRRSNLSLGNDLDVAIAKLVKAGKTSEAQSALFKALEGVIGGVAEAAGETLPGALNRLDQAVDNSKEKIGAELAPQITALANQLELFVIQHGKDFEEIGRAGGQFAEGFVSDLAGALRALDVLGVKIQDLPNLAQPFSAGLQVEQIALRKLTDEFGLSEESTAKLAVGTRALAASLELLKARQNAEAEAAREAAHAIEAEAVARDLAASKKLIEAFNAEQDQRHKLRDSIFGNVAALNNETDALIAVIEAEQRRGDVTEEQSAREVAAISAQLSKYDEIGVKPPQALAALAAALGILNTEQDKVRDSLLGNVDALNQETETLVTAVTQIIAHGDATKAQSARIVEAVTAQREKYAELGLKTPADLDAIIARLGILSTAQQKVTDATIQAFAALRTKQGDQPTADTGDAQKRVDTLKGEVDALEQQAAAGALTAQQEEELATKKNDLANAQQDLTLATLDGAKATGAFGEANQQSAANVQETVNQLREAHGEINQYGDELQGSIQELAFAADGHGKLKDGIKDVTDATVAATAATTDNAQSLADAASAAEKLRNEQEGGATAAGSMATETDKVTAAAQGLKDAKPEETIRSIATELGSGATKAKTLNDELRITVGLIADLKKSTLEVYP